MHTCSRFFCFCGRKHGLCFALQVFANATLRTLCLCYKDISADEYQVWSRKHKDAQVTNVDREGALDRVYEQIEKDLMVSGKQTGNWDIAALTHAGFSRKTE